MTHAQIFVLAESNVSSVNLNYLIGVLVVMMVCLLIGAIYGIKSSTRVKFEEERTKQKTIEAVSEGKLSMEDAEKLLNPKKKAWWKG